MDQENTNALDRIVTLQEKRRDLERELTHIEYTIKELWKIVPLTSPKNHRYTSDIAIPCRVCGKNTLERMRGGIAEHWKHSLDLSVLPKEQADFLHGFFQTVGWLNN